MCKRDDLVEGTYVVDTSRSKLYEVRENPSKTHVRLTDCSQPVGSSRFTPMLLQQAYQVLEVVEPAPDPRNTASEREFGRMGVAPE